MIVVLNGSEREVRDGSTVSELIESLGFGERTIVVERNGEPLERERFGSTSLQADDRIEIVRAVAGG